MYGDTMELCPTGEERTLSDGNGAPRLDAITCLPLQAGVFFGGRRSDRPVGLWTAYVEGRSLHSCCSMDSAMKLVP